MVEQVFLYTENGEEQLKTLWMCTKENVKMKVCFPKKSPSERTVTLVLGHISEEWWKKSFVPCRLPRDAIIFKIELSRFVCEENCFHHGSDKKYYRKQNCLHILCYSIILVVWEIFLLNFVKISHFNFSLKAFNCLRNSSDVFDLYFEFRALAS